MRNRNSCMTLGSVRKFVFYVFLIFKRHAFLHFFEMTYRYQKVVKSRQQKYSHQSVKMSSYTSLSITVIQFPAPGV